MAFFLRRAFFYQAEDLKEFIEIVADLILYLASANDLEKSTRLYMKLRWFTARYGGLLDHNWVNNVLRVVEALGLRAHSY
jgi:hypothetical protein